MDFNLAKLMRNIKHRKLSTNLEEQEIKGRKKMFESRLGFKFEDDVTCVCRILRYSILCYVLDK